MATDSGAQKTTIGPHRETTSPKDEKFDVSLGVTAEELEMLIQELVKAEQDIRASESEKK